MADNRLSLVDILTAVNQETDVFGIGLRRRQIQILQHISGELVLANLQGTGHEGRFLRFGTEV